MIQDITAESDAKDPQFAYTLARGFQVLNAFDSSAPFLSNREISQRTGIARSTVARLTRTLSIMGYLQYNASTTRYRLEASVLALGYPLLSQLTIRHIARAAMQELADLAKGAVSLGMRTGTNMVILESCINQPSPTGKPDVGALRPIATTALGAAYYCAVDSSERHAILDAIKEAPPAGAQDWQGFLASCEAAYAAKGYCIAKFEAAGVYVVAVPVRTNFDGEIMAFNCATAAFNLEAGDLESRIAPRLLALAHNVEMSIGRR